MTKRQRDKRKREDVKLSFTSSLLGYILFSVPYFQLPPYEEGGWKRDIIVLLTNVDRTDAVHITLNESSIS